MRPPPLNRPFHASALLALLLSGCSEGHVIKSGDCASNPDGTGATVSIYADADGDGHADVNATADTVCWNAIPDGMFVSCDEDVPSDLADAPCVVVDDCDDTNAAVYAGAPEVCDSVDNDCNGQIDENLDTTWYEDYDADGYGNDAVVETACAQPDGYVDIGGDCDDTDPATYPGATELTDGVDNNCSGASDPSGALPSGADLDELVQMTVTGFASTSGLSRGCVMPNSLARVFLGDNVLAVFPSDTEGSVNIGSATTSWPLDGSMSGSDRALACLRADLDSAGSDDVLTGAPGANAMQVTFQEHSDLYTMFTDDADSSFGASLANLGTSTDLVVGAPGGRGDVTITYEPVDYSDKIPKGTRTQLIIEGPVDGIGFGTALDASQDLTGDGVADLVVGALGSVTVLDGASLLVGEEEDVLTVTGEGNFGQVLTATPDLTGDGVPDLLIAAPDFGRAWIVPGQSYGSYAIDDIAWARFHGDAGAANAVVALETVGGGGPAIAIGDENNDRVLLFRKEQLASGDILALDETAASTVIDGTSGSAFGSALFDALDADGDGISELGVCARNDDDGRGACYVLATLK